jgi:hypothetical protein
MQSITSKSFLIIGSCYTSRVKSYAEAVQGEAVWFGWICGNRHSFCPGCGNRRALIRGLSAPVFEGIDFEEEKFLV